jgi:two-component system, OmpR family, sensor kinase
MRLRTQLVVTFTILLVAVIAAVGLVVVQSSRAVLTNQVDDDLRGIQIRIEPNRVLPIGVPDRGGDPSQRQAAHIVLNETHTVVYEDPSGFRDAPDPLPDISDLFDDASIREIVTVPAVDGSMHYRVFYEQQPDGHIDVWAAPLTEVDAAVSRLLALLLLAGAGVALIGATATWWLVRRGLQPVDDMVATATAIGSGDLSSRVPEATPTTELGQLGLALNEMMSQIEDAFAHEAEAQERLKTFVADASHELRTPIAAIQGYAELYRKGALDDQEGLDNAMRRVGADAARMHRLVSDLLLLARLDRGQMMEHRPVNIAHVIHDAVTDSQAIDPDRVITVEGPDSLRVLGDDQQLAQVLANLLGNARMHTPAGTSVLVRLAGKEDMAVIDVIDDGPGLPEEAISKVFDRFYRVDTSRARKSGGSGLGLAIVAAVVDEHGGVVEAANEPGRGARFTVRLPALVE